MNVRSRSLPAILLLAVLLVSPSTLLAQSQSEPATSNRPATLGAQLLRVLTLEDYNTRVVLAGTLLLGISAGLVGSFMLLRRRSLVGDVVSHAALPGVAVAFISMEVAAPGSGKSLPALLVGAAISGLLGVFATLAIRSMTRIKEDTALALVLSTFFGAGIALFSMIQSMATGNAAGLQQFIYGSTASMIAADVKLIAWASAGAIVLCAFLFKEFGLLCFDEDYARAQGWPVVFLDLVLMGMVVGVTVIGLRSVGLLLVVAMLITPAAAARFWTDHLGRMALVSAAIGGGSACLGVLVSDLFPHMAAGAVIVLAGSAFFLLSLLFGTRRGLLQRLFIQWRLERRVALHDLLRSFFEFAEPRLSSDLGEDAMTPGSAPRGELAQITITFVELLAIRSWSPAQLRHALNQAEREHLLFPLPTGGYRLTDTGAAAALRVARNHRLWELYLIHYADIAPSHVDRDADEIEHVLEPELIDELEALMRTERPVAERPTAVPRSPHPIEETRV